MPVIPIGLKRIIARWFEACIENGVVPILATKADNLEGDGTINATIVKVAQDYDVPLWNFWAALQDLPKQGLQDDGAHLTFYPNDFSDPPCFGRSILASAQPYGFASVCRWCDWGSTNSVPGDATEPADFSIMCPGYCFKTVFEPVLRPIVGIIKISAKSSGLLG